MSSDLPPFGQPGPSSSKDESSNERTQCPQYHYEMDAAESSVSTSQLYPVSLPAWPESPDYPSFMAMAVNPTPSSSYIYPPTSSLRLPPTEQIPPNCLDWTINPIKAPSQQFKTTPEPLFTLGYNSTVSENWMEGDKGLQYSIKNFTFSTKRTSNLNEASQVHEYDSLLVSIPQVYQIFNFFFIRNFKLVIINILSNLFWSKRH